MFLFYDDLIKKWNASYLGWTVVFIHLLLSFDKFMIILLTYFLIISFKISSIFSQWLVLNIKSEVSWRKLLGWTFHLRRLPLWRLVCTSCNIEIQVNSPTIFLIPMLIWLEVFRSGVWRNWTWYLLLGWWFICLFIKLYCNWQLLLLIRILTKS